MVRAPNQVRIIGGRWRGSRIPFPADAQIRPTPDRLRETVFNWLQNEITQAVCLDLFAGSGALGLEALSRGAQYLDSVDKDLRVVNHLRKLWQRFQITHGQIHHMNYDDFLTHNQRQYDIVFIDPPFHQEIVEKVCRLLDASNSLQPNALLYIEMHRKDSEVTLNSAELIREKTAGDVKASLWRYQG